MTKTNMVPPAKLSEKRKAEIKAEEKAALTEADKQRKRSLSARAADALMSFRPFDSKKQKEEQRKLTAKSTRKREDRYQAAKKQYETPFETRKNVLMRNDTPVKLSKEELDAPVFRRGGAVSVSRRADGIAQRGKTKGKMR